ncbi:tyrosine-protein phosphatase [Limosilactobacillus reuteri]|uniref:tyrosine-protein phosphatase n=1 Tax=Limosilactobacillus reuteri TaxID=1598 RepID=UPI001E2BD27A|nr:tyrosine-protein phosphatase [Limosilactobacillus reuteri]MCC4440789.1 tyrosine-protein phosphatase [Limosilactobacillus reuteri]
MVENNEINLVNAFNIRDLGGYSTIDNRTIKKRRLIRGSYLSSLDSIDQQKLYNYGVRVIIDLRTLDEVEKYPDQFISTTKYINIPVLRSNEGAAIVKSLVFKDVFPNQNAGYHHMQKLYYRLIASTEAQEAYHYFFISLAQLGDFGGILFHCSSGKDRTGVITFLLLKLLGIMPATICHDYLLTNQVSLMEINRRMNEARQVSVDPAYLKSIFDISTARLIYYKIAETTINYLYGSFNAYLHNQLNIDSILILKLKRLFLT